MAHILTSAGAVVDALGGVAEVAREFRVGETAIWNWIRRGYFPAHSYVLMHELLADRSASAPNSLWSMTMRASKQEEAAA